MKRIEEAINIQIPYLLNKLVQLETMVMYYVRRLYQSEKKIEEALDTITKLKIEKEEVKQER